MIERENISPLMLILLWLWILFVIVVGLVENFKFHQKRKDAKFDLDFPIPQVRTEFIKINLENNLVDYK